MASSLVRLGWLARFPVAVVRGTSAASPSCELGPDQHCGQFKKGRNRACDSGDDDEVLRQNDIMKSLLYGAALLLPISMAGGSANAEGDGRATIKTQYAVATANRDATDVGMQILASGGSAADAAVAIQMV